MANAIEPGMSDREKAIALWRQETTHRYHFGTADRDVKTPVKVFNVYGYNTCGDDSNCMAGLWRTAGLKVCPDRVMGHCITQVYYEGCWHLMDGDQHSIYLLRDNVTVAGERDLARDHDLANRELPYGPIMSDWRTARMNASLFGIDDDRTHPGVRSEEHTSELQSH